MWWCQLTELLKFETHPSSLLNFGKWPILPAERKFMLLSMAEVVRKLSSNIKNNLSSQESVFDRVETLYNTVVIVQWDNINIKRKKDHPSKFSNLSNWKEEA